jgi:hypothetical protein
MQLAALPNEQRWLLQRELDRMTSLQPRLHELRLRLLALGGCELVPPLERDPELDAVLERGCPFDGRGARSQRGLASDCHGNVARLYDRSGGRLRIATGYALSEDDGLWRQHSWAIGRDALIETTDPRLIYFGYVLGDREAIRFRACYR